MTPPERLQDVTLAERLLEWALDVETCIPFLPLPGQRNMAKRVAAMKEAAAALSGQQVPADGEWVLVPREPTPEMIEAGIMFGTSPNKVCIIYQSMLAATPPAESQPQGVEAVRELVRRLCVELLWCDRQCASKGMTQGVSVRDVLADSLAYLESTPKPPTPAVQIAAPGDVERLQRAYWLGWRNSAAWADRKDLWADRDSPAYTQERDDALGTLAAAVKLGKE